MMIDINFNDILLLHIDDRIISTIKEFNQSASDFEAGGIILGKKLVGCDEYYITDVSIPNKFDIRERFSFVRNKNFAQRIIDDNWAATNGIVNYLGEWHTHPFPSPMPSMTDKLLLRTIAIEKTNVFRYYFMVILGNTGHLFIGVASSDSKGKIFQYSILEV